MKQYIELIEHVLKNGTRKENRTGIDTLSTFNFNYTHDLNTGFPLLTTKEVSWKNIVIENLWFLSGSKDISFLQRHGCKFWDPWADEKGNVPSAYGSYWTNFPVHGAPDALENRECPAFNNQIEWVLNEMRRNPMSRRMVVSAWAPGNAQTSKLPPCHAMFVFNVQNKKVGMVANTRPGQGVPGEPTPLYKKQLCLHLLQRSADVALGIPYNLAGYAFITHLFAQMSGLDVGVFGHSLVDAHIYTKKADEKESEYDHVPGLLEQINRAPRELPTLSIDPTIRDLKDIAGLLDPKLTTAEIMDRFKLSNYNPHKALKFKVAV